MRFSTPSLVALLTLTSTSFGAKDCKGNNILGNQEIQCNIDPTYIIFPLEASFSDLISTIQSSTLKTEVGADTTTVVKDIFSSSCQMTVRTHSTSNITASQLGKLFSTSMDETELFCHSASVKIHNILEQRHTMLSRHFKLQIVQSGIAVQDHPSVEYWVTCPVAPEKVREQRDCGFCNRVKSELEGVCTLPQLGKMVDEMRVSFGGAKCDGCS